MEIKSIKDNNLLNDVIDKISISKLEDAKQRKSRYGNNILYVSDLTMCWNKSRLSRQNPDANAGIIKVPSVLIGSCLDDGIVNLISNHTDIDVEYEVSKQKTVGDYTIRGRCDMILDGQIIEIKFTRYLPESPRMHHIIQCRIYCWLYDVDNVLLWYFSPDGYREFNIERIGMSDENILNLIEEELSPRYSWECGYCQFNGDCD